jgi:hypothetical protein
MCRKNPIRAPTPSLRSSSARDVVVAHDARDLLGEELVDRAIAFEVGAFVFEQRWPEMQQRPQRAVREAEVVVLVFAAREVEQRVFDVAGVLGAERARAGIVDDVAAPADPQAAALGERAAQRGCEPARAGLLRQCDAIGDDDEPAHG